jgi:Sap, sulfolipid-1-addressing protein
MLASESAPLLTSLLFGVALAASPFGIVAAIVLLGTRRPIANTSAFASGWFLAIVAIGVGTAYLRSGDSASSGTTPLGMAIVEAALGSVLIVIALRRWRRRGSAADAKEPAWMARVERISPLVAFGLGIFLPTYGLILPVVNTIVGSGASKGAAIAMFLVFAVVGTLGVLVPLVLYARQPQESAARLSGWRTWLLANDVAVIAVILAVLGLVMLAHGAVGIASS